MAMKNGNVSHNDSLHNTYQAWTRMGVHCMYVPQGLRLKPAGAGKTLPTVCASQQNIMQFTRQANDDLLNLAGKSKYYETRWTG